MKSKSKRTTEKKTWRPAAQLACKGGKESMEERGRSEGRRIKVERMVKGL